MSAIADQSTQHGVDDRLARRNALVLAAGQALAGGNNTVIVATSAIIGVVLAPDKGLATLPITMMVFGMWFGTVPLGLLVRRYGRRNALQVGSLFGVLSGLISCAGGADRKLLAASAWHVLRRALCRRASVLPLRRRGYGKRDLPAESHFLGARWRHLCRHYRAAARHLHQGLAVAASLCRDLSRPVIVRACWRPAFSSSSRFRASGSIMPNRTGR